MKSLIVLILSGYILVSCNGIGDYETGNGDIVTKNIPVSDFRQLVISGNFDVLLVEKEGPALAITTDNNLHEHIEVKQDGDVLRIDSKKNLRSTNGVEMQIEYTKLNMVESGGASMVTNRGVLTGDKFTVNMAGAGAMKMHIEVDQLQMNISGAGSVELSGKARQQAVKLSGAGGLNASDLLSEYAEINISGVGGAKVHVTETLNASVSGVGGITYFGNPKEVRRDVSGLGSISKAK